ncbi:hypothetical protein VTH82DRAFT_7949 [Thermothelomyces myriococcoides]
MQTREYMVATTNGTKNIERLAAGRPRGSTNLSGGKYGRCPHCGTGRRVRSRFNPYGQSVHRGKFRFVCSNRPNQGCGYSEVLDSDPALDPESYLEHAAAHSQAASDPAPVITQNRGQGQSRGRTHGPGASGSDSANLNTSPDGTGRGFVTRGEHNFEYEEDGDDNENENDEDPESAHRHPLTTTARAFNNRVNEERAAGRVITQQRLGCPQCMHGRLSKKLKKVGRMTEAILVCERGWDGRIAAGGCGYEVDIGIEPADNDDGDAGGGAIAAEDQDTGERAINARARIRQLKRNSTRQLARERKEKEKLIIEERARAMADPNAAAVMTGHDPKTKRKKILVDLTGDDELMCPTRPELVGEAVGPYAPVFIVSSDEDDEEEEKKITPHVKPVRRRQPSFRTAEVPRSLSEPETSAVDDFDSVDDAELVRFAELAEKAGSVEHKADDGDEKGRRDKETYGKDEEDIMLLDEWLISESNERELN